MARESNPGVKYLRRLENRRFRAREMKFLVEGIRFAEEALDSGWAVELIVYCDRAFNSPRGEALLETAKARGIMIAEINEAAFKQLAETETPQGVMAVVRRRDAHMDDLRVDSGPALLVVADGVQDPGNLGTIVRSADAAGAGGVILLKGCADIYNPKALRSSMGSIFHLPVVQGFPSIEVMAYLARQGIKIVAGDTRGEKAVYDCDLTVPCALVTGSEAGGISSVVRETVTELVRIPMPGRAESLNVAISASILLYEAVRQRGG